MIYQEHIYKAEGLADISYNWSVDNVTGNSDITLSQNEEKGSSI